MNVEDQEKRDKKTLLFAVAGYNLAETGRMLEIAKAARADFDILFISYGGQFEELIRREGFTLREMEPRLTRRKLKRLRTVLNGDTWNTVDYFSYRDLAKHHHLEPGGKGSFCQRAPFDKHPGILPGGPPGMA
jgi:hypothetical protein